MVQHTGKAGGNFNAATCVVHETPNGALGHFSWRKQHNILEKTLIN